MQGKPQAILILFEPSRTMSALQLLAQSHDSNSDVSSDSDAVEEMKHDSADAAVSRDHARQNRRGREVQRSAAAREPTQISDEENNWIAATVEVTEIVALDQLAAAAPSPPLTEERTTLMSLFDSDDEEPPAPLLPPPNNFEATPTPQQREAVPKRSGGRAKRCGSCASCSSGNRKL